MNQNPRCTNAPQAVPGEGLALEQAQQRQTLAEDIALLVVRQYRRMKRPIGQPKESPDEPDPADNS
jgi:hypothetical protein